MSYVNKAILVGRLGKDPEVRRTPGGAAVARFSLATNETWTDRNGERQERTEWHNIVVWNKLAEICEQYLAKGKLIYIEGRIQTREYDDKDGNKRRITEIVANEMKMLGSKEGERGSYSAPASDTSTKESTAEPQPPGIITDEDIPF
jgi:single-strand DNA-binding protein